MTNHNSITLMGRIGRPELISFTNENSEKSISKKIQFGLCTYNNKEAQWHDIEVVGQKTIEQLRARNLTTGNIVLLTGTLCYKNWKDPSGKNRKRSVIYVTDRNDCRIVASSISALNLAEKINADEDAELNINIDENDIQPTKNELKETEPTNQDSQPETVEAEKSDQEKAEDPIEI